MSDLKDLFKKAKEIGEIQNELNAYTVALSYVQQAVSSAKSGVDKYCFYMQVLCPINNKNTVDSAKRAVNMINELFGIRTSFGPVEQSTLTESEKQHLANYKGYKYYKGYIYFD